MLDFFRHCVLNQFEAALSMFQECIEQCPPEHWESRVAQLTVRQIAYHTLFFVDAYLSPSESAFALRELNHRGGDERVLDICPGLSQAETLEYLALCREKLLNTLTHESAETLQGPSGFPRRRFSRGELHLYNLRHVQHHSGQLSAHLRRVDERFRSHDTLKWIGSGRQLEAAPPT